MKLKTLLKIVFLLLVFLMIFDKTAGATPNFHQLMPNSYEENEFEDNKEYLHEQSLFENKEPIPEEQKELTFTKKNDDPIKQISEQLFAGDSKMNHPVTVKAEQLGLFSNFEKGSLYQEDYSKKPMKQNSQLMILYIGLVILAMVVMLVFLIPKMAQGKQTTK